MHPEVRVHEPGKCPGCGMDLIPQKKSADVHAGRDPEVHASHDNGAGLEKMPAPSGVEGDHTDHEAAMPAPHRH